jgi:acyl-CoA thioesterase-1
MRNCAKSAMRSNTCYKLSFHNLGCETFNCLRAIPLIFGIALLISLSGCSESPGLKPLSADTVILAFGDSLTYGTGAEPEESYPVVLAQRIDRKVVNAGIPGEVSADGLERLPELLREVKPSLVILIHGGNDLLQRKNKPAAVKNIIAMIDLIRGSGAQVVMAGVPDFGLFLSTAKFYLEIAEQRSVPIEAEILPSLLSDLSKKSDRVHPNADGYRELAIAMETLLEDNGALP